MFSWIVHKSIACISGITGVSSLGSVFFTTGFCAVATVGGGVGLYIQASL
jgi:hypothetical protein